MCHICRRNDAFSNRHFRDYARAGFVPDEYGTGSAFINKRHTRKIRRVREDVAWKKDWQLT